MTIRKYIVCLSNLLVFIFSMCIVGCIGNDSVIPKISVIVPVYNVEKYLPQCLDSITNQTFKEIEIICVDDGSKDNSGNILDEYANKDNRIKVIHQKNGGLSVARNTGLNICSGEYITFVDSDDYINPLTYEYLYKYAKNDDVDLLEFGYRRFSDVNDWYDIDEKKKFDFSDVDLSDGKIVSIDEFIEDFQSMVWCHFYKNELIQKDKVRFVPNMTPGEDDCFNFLAMADAHKIKILPSKFYYYRKNVRGSLSTKKSSNWFTDSSRRNEVPKIVCDNWRNRGLLKGREHLLLSKLIKFISRKNHMKYAKEILDSFGNDIYNREVIKKCPEEVQNIIKDLENNIKNKVA